MTLSYSKNQLLCIIYIDSSRSEEKEISPHSPSRKSSKKETGSTSIGKKFKCDESCENRSRSLTVHNQFITQSENR